MESDSQVDANALRARARMKLVYSAAAFAFLGGLALCTVTLIPLLNTDRIPQAAEIFFAVLPTATMIIGWYKGRDSADKGE